MRRARLTGLAPAKINLFLHVGPVRHDGRHDLDSLLVFSGEEATDRLSLQAGETTSLQVTGPMAPGAGPTPDNLVLRVIHALATQTPLELELEKNLPSAAGIGGGSADAGAALRLVTQWLGLDQAHAVSVAPRLGGDVLACLYSEPLMMRGDGDQVSPLAAPLPPLPALLVNPGVPCPTGPVFHQFDAAGGGAGFTEIEVPAFTQARALIDWLGAKSRNDLQGPAIKLVPQIGDCLEKLAALPGAQLTRMTGSGATCFALFERLETARAAGKQLLEARPYWWVRATMLGEGAT